jgi:hypothetical protein
MIVQGFTKDICMHHLVTQDENYMLMLCSDTDMFYLLMACCYLTKFRYGLDKAPVMTVPDYESSVLRLAVYQVLLLQFCLTTMALYNGTLPGDICKMTFYQLKHRYADSQRDSLGE